MKTIIFWIVIACFSFTPFAFAEDQAWQSHAEYQFDTWQQLVADEATGLNKKIPHEVDRLYGLNGLRAQHYLQWRRPEPAVFRELQALPHLTAAMMDIFLNGLESYPWSGRAYEEEERLALQNGILHAVGESGHPAAVLFLSHVIDSQFESRSVRLSAIAALTKTGSADALLVLGSRQEEARHDVELRAWIAGSLGHIRNLQSWPMVQRYLNDPAVEVKRAALGSIRLLMSRRHWQTRPQELRGLRQLVTPVLLGLLEQEKSELDHRRVGETLALVGGSGLRNTLQAKVLQKGAAPAVRARVSFALQLVERAERRR